MARITITDKIKERGLDLTSWLVFNYNHYLPQRYPDAAKHDPFGHINFAQLCPASPLVRDYARALCRDIAAQFQPDEFHLESLGYLHFSYGFRNPKVGVKITPFCELLMGLCYCQHCLQRASALGLDGESFRADVAEYLARELASEPTPEDMQPPSAEFLATAFSGRLQTFLDARVEAATSLVEEAIAIANQAGARVSFFGGRDRTVNGLDSDRVLRNVYMVNAGVGGEPDALAASVRTLRGEFPADTDLSAIVNPGGFADSDALGAHLTAPAPKRASMATPSTTTASSAAPISNGLAPAENCGNRNISTIRNSESLIPNFKELTTWTSKRSNAPSTRCPATA